MAKEPLCGFSVSDEGLGNRTITGYKRKGIYAARLENKHKRCWKVFGQKGLVLHMMGGQNFVLENLFPSTEPETELHQSNVILENVVFLPIFPT